MVNVYSNCVQSVVNSVSNEDIGDESAPIVVVGAGQSLMANWGSTSGLFNTDGNRGMLDTLNAHNHTYTNKFVNSGDGSSCLLRSTCISTSQADQDDYWIDDCGYYAAGTAPWNGSTGVKSYFRGEIATLPTRGVRYDDMLADLVTASVSTSEITDVVWSQGESEASSISSGSITQAQYVAGMQKLFDFFIEDFSSLKLIQIRPIERRAQGNNIVGFEGIRNSQRTICANNPNISVFGSEAYDLQLYNDVLLGSFTATASQTVFNLTDYPSLSSSVNTRIVLNNETDLREDTDYTRSLGVITFSSGLTAGDTLDVYVDDAVHRSPSANYIEGTRAAFTILKHRGLYNGSSLGSIISSASYDGDTVSLTMTHENGSSYQFADGEKYLGTSISRNTPYGGQFTIIDPDGEILQQEQVLITGNNIIEVTPSRSLTNTGEHTVYIGYGDILPYNTVTTRVDIDSMVIDNAVGNTLPPRTTVSATFNGSSILPSTTSLVVNRNFTADAPDYSSIPSALSDAVITGKSIPFQLGIMPTNTSSSIALNNATFTTSLYRSFNKGKRYTYHADSITATGGQTVFNLSWSSDGSDIQTVTFDHNNDADAARERITLVQGTDYSVSLGVLTLLTYTADAGDILRVYPNVDINCYSNVVQFPDSLVDFVVPFTATMDANYATATSGQTVFPIGFTVESGEILAVYNGSTKLTLGTDYTISGNNIVLSSGATSGASIRWISVSIPVTLPVSVNTSYSAVYLDYNGMVTISNSSFATLINTQAVLTNSNTVTITSEQGNAVYSKIITGYVVQFKSTAIKNLVPININVASGATTGTQSLASLNSGTGVTMANTIVIPSGIMNTGSSLASTPARTKLALQLSDANTVTGRRTSNTANIAHTITGYVVEFNSGIVTVQHGSTAMSTLTSSATTTITAVDTSKSFILIGGWLNNSTSTITSVNPKEYLCRASLNSSTQVKIERIDATSTSTNTCYWQVITLP